MAADAVLELIDSSKAYVDDDPERFYREVQALLDPVVDFDRFARNVMGAHGKRATPEQRQRFMDDHVYPNEAEYYRQHDALADRWETPAMMEELKEKARAAGAWRLPRTRAIESSITGEPLRGKR